MPKIFTVSPDFTPDHLSGWFIFNTWMQRTSGIAMHLELYDSFEKQREAIRNDAIDLIYANPFDASMLVREKGFKPLVRPIGKADEALVAVAADAVWDAVEEFPAGIRLASTKDPDVHQMGMIMLEPADLDASNVELSICESYVLVAKSLLRGTADAGIFLDEAYDDLSSVIRSRLKVVVRGQIQVVHHVLLAGPALADALPELQQTLLNMTNDPKGLDVLQSLGFAGWEALDEEDAEFMIDLMDALAA